MKNRFFLWFLILLSFSFAIFFSCASTSEEEQNDIVPIVEPQEIPENIDSPVVDAESEISAETTTETEQKTELVGTLLPEIKQKTTYFEFEDSSIMEYAKIGSPSAIKTAISKIKNPAEKYTEEEAVLLAVLHTVMTNVWVSEPVSFTVPKDLPENVYTGIIDYVNKGIFDTNAGKSDFYTLVLPCVVLCKSNPVAFYEDIESNLLEAINQDEKSVLAHYLLGLLYKNKKESEKSFYHFEVAYNLDSSCFEIVYEYANALYNAKQFGKAYELASSLKNPEDQNLGLLELCARSALAIGKLDIAESYVGKLLQKDPENQKIILLRAEILFEKEEYLRVSSLLDAYSKSDKSDVKYLLLRSKLQNKWNRNTPAAISTITEALNLYPENHDVLLCAAELASETGSLVNGKSALELIAPLKQDQEDSPILLKIELSEYSRLKDWNKAFEISEKILNLDSSLESKLSYISICLELNKNEKAFKVAEEIYSSNKGNEDVQLAYIRSLISYGKQKEARTLIEELLPNATSKMKSSLYYQRSRIETTEEKKLSSLRSSLTANPRNQDALFDLYKLYFNKNDYRKAQYYLKQVIALNPNDQELLDLNTNLESYLY